jgi:hypothetical protein
MKLGAHVGTLALLLLACTSTAPEGKQAEREKAPDAPALVLADAPGCDECTFGPEGQCHIDEGDPHVQLGERPRDHRTPCAAACCDRFPIRGGLALLRPGKPLFDDAWSDSPITVARVPRGPSGLIVRITAIPDEDDATSRLQVETVGTRPEACAPALDDLPGVILRGAVESSHLGPVTDECTAAIYAAHDQTPRDPHPGRPTVVAGTLLGYPFNPEDAEEIRNTDAGRLIDTISLPSDTRITRENDMDCFRLPGILKPRVCVEPTAIQRAAEQ